MLSPLPAGKWNYRAAAHLLNRAGFGGSPSEIQNLVKMGPEKAVAHFVDYEKIPDIVTPPDWADATAAKEFMEKERAIRMELRDAKSDEERKEIRERQQKTFQMMQRDQFREVFDLRGWWLKRMATGSRPLQEKLVLFWHGHFATSAQKVRSGYMMYLQNATFRKYASGNWEEFLVAVAEDPAMLIWLDQAQSKRQHPNENFAREVMELFSLGEGHYTEKDVTEAARALTGFSLERETMSFVNRPFLHDPGEKTIFGKTGVFNGYDFLKMLVAQPQAARFISWKLWRFFGSENPSDKLIDALAENFRKNGNNFKPLLHTMFRSKEFYADDVIGTQVKSPTQWLVASCKMLERELPPAVVSSEMLRSLGQELLAPPNVKGWDGGLNWITTNNLLARYNQAAMLVLAEGKVSNDRGAGGPFGRIAERANDLIHSMHPVDVTKLMGDDERQTKDKVIPALEKRFLAGGQLKEKQRKVLRDYLDTRGDLDEGDIRHAIRLMMCTPEYQLT